MLHQIILKQCKKWLVSEECTVRPIIEYIKKQGKLRDAQIEAIEIYLYLKIKGGNNPLWYLFVDGFFNRNEDLSLLNINETARSCFERDVAARALFEFSRLPNNGNGRNGRNSATLFPELENYLIEHSDAVNYNSVIKNIFYNVEYTDYLFSLPMGAGKTFLMAAFVYLDLYFALNEPENKVFAHNFIVLVPSGLKSSIVPSLKTIEKFDPSWILPEPAATTIKRMIKFEVLDQPKSAKKSNKARNPNSQKIYNYQPFDSLMGLVMVVNAEKVILDRLGLTEQYELIEYSDDEKDRFANELRNIISKLPNLQIHIDEVHHAATDDIKLRQVVNKWNRNGTINSVIGYSGTPYLSSAEMVKISDTIQLKFSQITNTVFYYPLTTAVRKFLKKPRVEQTSGLQPIQIIEKGIRDFLNSYDNTIYANGACAKLAIYCGSIERLEEEVFHYLTGAMKINPDMILKYHKGNKKFKIPRANETEFASLDTPLSKKKIILLVQIGKEGWDCRSLTGVILSQKGDCPTNMVLQTSCRCLRQVDAGKHETAVIWMNEENAKILDKQLKDEQHTSIQELNTLLKDQTGKMVDRFSRLEYLKLPPVDFYQLKIEYDTLVISGTVDPLSAIESIDLKESFDAALIIERGLNPDEPQNKEFLLKIKGETADFGLWIFTIARESFNSLSLNELNEFGKELKPIFDTITFYNNGILYFNDLYKQDLIRSLIRLAFHQHRDLKIKTEIVPKSAQLLFIGKLDSIPENDKIYPNENDTRQIIDLDASGKDPKDTLVAIRKTLEMQGLGYMAESFSFSSAIYNKDKSFHYLPYNFSQSRFEMMFLQDVLNLTLFNQKKLEVYYNGERHLTDFRIACYSKKNDRWLPVVKKYTPDFLIIRRKNQKIHKILIVETKGSGFADQPGYRERKSFMETEFLRMNNDEYGYKRFEYISLSDDVPKNRNLSELTDKLRSFFEEN
ncbi:MAG: DEAD/DEAH box helicase family protein [Candidatus Latescibacter sp.]|nr:DEAD/DEAH box helicase family protein [Candidatus Latescibacter sp.]